jgi:hypothetical protein
VKQQSDVADVLSVSTETGEVRHGLGNLETGRGIAAEVAYWGPWGFISVPPAPADGAAAMAWYWQDGNEKRILGFHDNRYTDRVGELAPGDSAIVTDGEARVMVKRERDLVTLYSQNRATGYSMAVTVDAEGGIVQLLNGETSIELHADKIVLSVSGGGSLVLDKSGAHIGGTWLAVNTAGGHLGVLPPGVPPVVGVQSVVAGPTGVAGVGSTRWTVTT